MTASELRASLSLASIFGLRLFGMFVILPVFALYAQGRPGWTLTLVGIALGAYGLTQGLLQIPFGTTCSYAEIARKVGRAGASRAVGQANHQNPIPIVVPCHRVITSNGTLGGYGGGLEMKRALLDLEKRTADKR